MNDKYMALDNIYIERFWRMLKYDYIYFWSLENTVKLANDIGWLRLQHQVQA